MTTVRARATALAMETQVRPGRTGSGSTADVDRVAQGGALASTIASWGSRSCWHPAPDQTHSPTCTWAGTDVPAAIKNGPGRTITTLQLPLALFIVVLLFLLVQNRIDRRDPKLAAAPVTAEPELTFGPILRPGGATA